jgi:hypothetical protein
MSSSIYRARRRCHRRQRENRTRQWRARSNSRESGSAEPQSNTIQSPFNGRWQTRDGPLTHGQWWRASRLTAAQIAASCIPSYV